MTTHIENTLGPEDLAKILHRKESTIRTDCRRRPQSLPPRLKIPGSRRLLWLESEVSKWLREQQKARA